MESMWLICSCNYRWYAQTYYIFHNTTFVICCWPWPAPSIYFWPYGIRQSLYDHQLKLWRYVGQEERLDIGGGILLTSLKSPQLALGGPDTYLLMMDITQGLFFLQMHTLSIQVPDSPHPCANTDFLAWIAWIVGVSLGYRTEETVGVNLAKDWPVNHFMDSSIAWICWQRTE